MAGVRWVGWANWHACMRTRHPAIKMDQSIDRSIDRGYARESVRGLVEACGVVGASASEGQREGPRKREGGAAGSA